MEFIESLYDNINRSTYGSAWKWYETIEEIEYRAPFKKIKNNYYCEYCEKKDKYLNAKRVYEDYKQNEETCPDMLNQLWYMWIDRKLDMKLHGEPCDCLIRWERDQHGLVTEEKPKDFVPIDTFEDLSVNDLLLHYYPEILSDINSPKKPTASDKQVDPHSENKARFSAVVFNIHCFCREDIFNFDCLKCWPDIV